MAEIINITIAVDGEQFVQRVEGTHWTKDDEGNRYVYNEDSDDDNPVAEVSPEHFASITKEPQ